MPNAVEKFFSEALRSFPRFKAFLVKIYHRIFYCFANTKNFFKPGQSLSLKAQSVTNKNMNCFFGYYDKCPWDKEQRYLLYLQVPFGHRMPKPSEAATLCFVDLKNNNQSHTLAQTTAWCWQQGCMMQWIEGSSDLLVIYNAFQGGNYVSIISDLNGTEKKVLPLPVYAISKDSKQAVSLNFSRLHHGCAGYGYIAKPYLGINELHPPDDGIRHMDMETGKYKLIISLDDITRFSPKQDFSHSFHYFNHLEFNPSGTRFVFLHRWFQKRGANVRGKQYTRMFTAKPDGSDIYCLADHEMVSHFAWKNDKQILAWANHPSRGNRYYVFEDKEESVKVVGERILNRDGHPSYSPDKRWLITDTYPNKARVRTLILFDLANQQRIDINFYKAPFKFYGPCRCDLHPRWSRDGQKVCFDSVHEGKRQIYIVDLSEIINSR